MTAPATPKQPALSFSPLRNLPRISSSDLWSLLLKVSSRTRASDSPDSSKRATTVFVPPMSPAMNMFDFSPRPWRANCSADDQLLPSTGTQSWRPTSSLETLLAGSSEYFPSNLILRPSFRPAVSAVSSTMKLAKTFVVPVTFKTTLAAFASLEVTLSISPVRKRYLFSYFLVVPSWSAVYSWANSSAVNVAGASPDTSVTTHLRTSRSYLPPGLPFPRSLTVCPGVALSHGGRPVVKHKTPSKSLSPPCRLRKGCLASLRPTLFTMPDSSITLPLYLPCAAFRSFLYSSANSFEVSVKSGFASATPFFSSPFFSSPFLSSCFLSLLPLHPADRKTATASAAARRYHLRTFVI